MCKQGSDLIDLRPGDMEGYGEFDFLGDFLGFFGVILEDFWRTIEEFWRNWFVEERTSRK